MRGITTAVLLLIGLAACGGDGSTDQGQPDAPAADTAPVVTAVRPTTPAQSDAPFGTRFVVPEKKGRTVTVHDYEAPLDSVSEYVKPEPGTYFAAVEVEECVGPAGEPAIMESPSRLDFDLALPDGERVHHSFMPVREPQLIPVPLKGGECARGWVTFEVPTGVTPRSVVYITGNYDALASWRIP